MRTISKGKYTTNDLRTLAESNLFVFAALVNPTRMYGHIHEELFNWWTRSEAQDHQLVLLPRGHQKSHCLATRVAWEITRNPSITILYVSATSTLAEKQLLAIKNILTSKVYQRYWPNMILPDEGKREKWTATEISVDHPSRKVEGIRDSTVFAAGLTTNVTGLHCDIAVLDDLVVPANAYTDDGREKVAAMYSQLSSIETTGSKEWVAGTRYHQRDLYQNMLELEECVYAKGDEELFEPVYEVFERQVEDQGDGYGEFLWPRQRRKDGKYFGFNDRELARKKAKYIDRDQFYAQYYNDPSNPENKRIAYEKFQYYDKEHLAQRNGYWYLKGRKLNIVAAMDLAFSLSKKSDFTVIVVVGIDEESNIYVLDIDRFKTNRTSTMFEHALNLHRKWDFRKMRIEVNVGQVTIANEFREKMKRDGVYFKIDEYRPSRHDGSKEERMAEVLEPRYDDLMMWHYRGGYCQMLEDELVSGRPEHDDIKDALHSAVMSIRPPARKRSVEMNLHTRPQVSSRFGGVGVVR